jgi:hypothetical protein
MYAYANEMKSSIKGNNIKINHTTGSHISACLTLLTVLLRRYVAERRVWDAMVDGFLLFGFGG